MLCILRFDTPMDVPSALSAHTAAISITGWIVATDIDDARRQAQAAFDNDLASTLYRMPFPIARGKHIISPNHLMLVS